ncbi:MAG: hypothetical protein KZQ78_06885 [Candidatus Thiodiazotropha sp. (ex Ustalcina ferruginea)]|nr:hypothetical protein [Candidatus Thiodiazotropha sp. (ex Ustalcina ferruginea)]
MSSGGLYILGQDCRLLRVVAYPVLKRFRGTDAVALETIYHPLADYFSGLSGWLLR